MSMKPIKIEGQLFWSQWMKKFNPAFNKSNTKYECTLGQLSAKDCQALQELGVKIKEKSPEKDTAGMGKHIVGKSKFEFVVLDQDGKEIPNEKIGNGTKVVALVTSYRHDMTSMHGMAPSIKTTLYLKELVERPSSEGNDQEDDDIL